MATNTQNCDVHAGMHPLPDPPTLGEMQDAVDLALVIAIDRLGGALKDADPQMTVKISGSLVAIGRLLEQRRAAQIESAIEVELDEEHVLGG